jgi:hypothetical protein
MADLLLALALAAWLTLWILRDTGRTDIRRGAGLRWAQRRATPPSGATTRALKAKDRQTRRGAAAPTPAIRLMPCTP